MSINTEKQIYNASILLVLTVALATPIFVFAEGNPTIVSVTPNTIYYSDEVDIIGSGFGDIGGIVFLAPPDDSSQGQVVISWTDTKIRVRVNNAHLGDIKLAVGAWNESGSKDYSDPSPTITIAGSCIADVWSPGEWSECGPDGFRTIDYIKTFECDVVDTPKPDSPPSPPQPCTYNNPSCISFSYSDWGECKKVYGGGENEGYQNRDVTSKYPADCQGGSTNLDSAIPQVTQLCKYTPPCSSDTWACDDWNICSSYGSQTRTCKKTFDCSTTSTPSPSTSQSCTPPPPPQPACVADTWTCGVWGACSLSGIQNRSCTKTFDCSSVETAPPITAQYCEAPKRPTQQIPQDSSDQISNQAIIIKSTVKLLCPFDAKRASQGSGTVIDSGGTILTNKHVVAGTLGCLVGFINDFNDEPYFGERHIADILKVSPNLDIAILKIRNPQNKRLQNVDITKGSSNLRLGTEVSTYGFPASFGTKITYTSGDFSGTDGNYLKTTAILEYGNSGGGAYLKNGVFVGVPSAVVRGKLNALGYILSINTINAWLGNSTITSSDTSSNQYSRVSLLEDIDLKTLNSLKLFIPETDESGDIIAPVVPTADSKTQEITEQPRVSQTQEESTVIESADTKEGKDKESKEEKENNSSTKVSEQRKRMVASAVQEIVKVAERSGEVGQQIKEIAQAQTKNQERLETGIQKVQNRSGFVRFFIGPNYGEIKNSQKLLNQNKEQIQKLDQLRSQVIDEGDQLQVIRQIQSLKQANQQIETSLTEVQKGFSLLGWIFRLFAK